MPIHPSVKECTHIKVTGVRCGSPALRGEQFCYFHQRMIRGVKTPPGSRLHPIALIENEEAIQASLMEVINALARNTIDLRRADLILKALYIAVRNSQRARFNNLTSAVTEVPDYPAAPEPPKPAPGITVIAVSNTATGYAEIQTTPKTVESQATAGAPLLADFARSGSSDSTPDGPRWPTSLRYEHNPTKTDSAIYDPGDPTQRKPPSSVKRVPERRRKTQAARNR
ncbi:MAG TPA: hypothetical protein VGM18_04520 [Candidatus Sulfotelmatobacter sp.]